MNNLRQRVNYDQLMEGGYGEIYIRANSMLTQFTSGATSGTIEMPTNKEMVDYFRFNPYVVSYVGCEVGMPDDWDGGGLKAKFYGLGSGSASAESIIWGIQACSVSGGELVDKTFSAEVTASAMTYVDPDKLEISTPSPMFYVDPSGLNTDGMVFFKLHRRGDADTHTGPGKLHSIRIQYRRSNLRNSSW